MGDRIRWICWAGLAAMLLVADASGAPQRRKTYDFMGVVDRVDTSAHTLVVRIGSKKNADRETIRYDVDTEFVRSKRPADAGVLRPDMRVWVYLREDAQGKPTSVARRITIADPYPDIVGTITAVDVKRGTIEISRQYPGGKAGDRPQTLTVRVTRETVITMEKRTIKLDEIPVGRRCQVTSARGSDNKTTDAASKITVWKATSSKAPGGAAKKRGDEDDGGE